MNRCMTLVCLLVIGLGGCSGESASSAGKGNNVFSNTNENKGHHHAAGDKLVWPLKDVEHEGYLISLGHHGDHFHGGDMIEPAAIVTRDGQAVSNARVFNALVSEDGQKVLVDEVAAVFEPETDHEPAHFAQGELQIPKGVTVFLIRFRIELPDVEQPYTSEVRVEGH